MPNVLRNRGLLAAAMVGGVLGAMIVFFGVGIAFVAPAMLATLLLLLLVRFTTPSEEGQYAQVLWWTLASFGAHFVFGFIVTNAGGIVSLLLKAPDALTYNFEALRITQHWEKGFPFPTLPSGKEGYYYLLAGLYRVLGPHAVAGLVVNAALAAAIVPLTADTTRRLFGREAAAWVPPVVVLLPSLMLWPSQLIKEAPILFLIAVAANAGARVTERFRFAPLVAVAGSMALLLTLRGYVALVLAGGIVAGIAVGRRELLGGVGAGVGVAAILILLLSFGLGYKGFDAAVNTDLAQAQIVRRDLALTARSGFDAEVDISTSRQALSYLPRGLVTFLAGPFPWQIRGVRQLPIIPDMLIWWGLLPSLWRGAKEGRRLIGRRMLVLVLPALTTACLLSLAIGNFGTLVRERMQLVVLLIPLIAYGLSLRRPKGVEEKTEPGELVGVA